jgi:hypothetical protein
MVNRNPNQNEDQERSMFLLHLQTTASKITDVKHDEGYWVFTFDNGSQVDLTPDQFFQVVLSWLQ